MSNKQQRGKLTEITRQEAEDKRIVLLMKYKMQNGFLNWGKFEMEMECDYLSWKKVLTQYSILGGCRQYEINNCIDILCLLIHLHKAMYPSANVRKFILKVTAHRTPYRLDCENLFF